MASTRFPGKPLADLCGKPMVQWVFEAAVAAGVSHRVIVATPDAEIAQACVSFGAECLITRADHPSGTDRIAEVAEHVPAEVFINVQGDEPLIALDSIRAVAAAFDVPKTLMASVYVACEPSDIDNPNVVKVVTDSQNQALYFSRCPIPYPRNERTCPVKKHLGIYGYRRQVLEEFNAWAPGALETTESLEQLRFLENGVAIRMVEGKESGVSVDTPEQAEQARLALMASRSL